MMLNEDTFDKAMNTFTKLHKNWLVQTMDDPITDLY